jgi:UDP-N-acetylglucosamine 2-epimerase (non-hydrolysing)
MIDSLRAQLPRARAREVAAGLGVARGAYAVATLHRPSNVDEPAVLRDVLDALVSVAARMPVVFPIHPRTRKNAEAFGLAGALAQLRTLEPLGYVDMLSLTDGAAACLTDSGGLQEETTALGVPCVTLREQTERPVTVTEGTNRMAPWPLTVAGIVSTFEAALTEGRSAEGARIPDGWDGQAALRIVNALKHAS